MVPSTSATLPSPADTAPFRFRTLPEWLAWQERLHFTAIELGLDRCRTVAERMGLLNPDFSIVSIAGTNGKGSSAEMLDLILRKAGYKTGKYTSPHLIRYNERICLGGVEAGDDQLCHAFRCVDKARGNVSLTYFEFGTLAALDIFRNAGIELAILEVGLGGRLDAVNMVDADVAMVTTVDMDHERWLGFDRDSIGREKAGIFRAGRAAICVDPQPPGSVHEVARKTGARYFQLHRDFSFATREETWDWEADGAMLPELPKPGINHDRQVQNAAGVLMALSILEPRFPVSRDIICSGLREFRLPGRLQIVPAEVPYIFDVAHNKQAAEVLAINLARLACPGETHLIIGMLKDKNHQAVLTALADAADRWYFSSLPDERAASGGQLAQTLAGINHRGSVMVFDHVAAAMDAVSARAAAGDRIVITGSFVTVGVALRRLNIFV